MTKREDEVLRNLFY